MSSEWQPIETAPRDGTPLLLYLKREPERHYPLRGIVPNYAIGFWEHRCWKAIEGEDCGSMGGEFTGWMEDWVGLDLEPTHWLPLPPPPQMTGTGE